MNTLRQLLRMPPVYAKLAWWGLVLPRREHRPQVVHQGVVLDEDRVLLSVRSDLRGWELPGGNPNSGETGEEALRREILEETGVEIEVERRVGRYIRSGFRPHTAEIWRCRALGTATRPSRETPLVRWFSLDVVPGTLFPWYRGPLADALADRPKPVERHERWGVREILQGFWIDLRMRLTADRSGEV
ncbi:MAG: NUDIX domain-containing protein [Myxococcota bacterium]|nr:hypothetical protein [Deltaproteobacteria bacterium]MCP4241459.1 NUDIX domain-containing protein [bacterium]MDP6074031.1 NUDIX domain-containing protein [Myxococcota bacterium]MDP6242679.1 NUDIX domain-containing protein [Myxococcota bacterium]MDP7073448.1 NUDIX domain-containing protein [Myxococcota bacterium]